MVIHRVWLILNGKKWLGLRMLGAAKDPGGVAGATAASRTGTTSWPSRVQESHSGMKEIAFNP